MTKGREVIERDFRQPEFVDAKPEDYEFRDDGKVVRKDRWEMAVYKIATKLGFPSHKGGEIDDVLAAVASAAEIPQIGWIAVSDRLPESSDYAKIKLSDGSIFIDAIWQARNNQWLWNGAGCGGDDGLSIPSGKVTHWAIR